MDRREWEEARDEVRVGKAIETGRGAGRDEVDCEDEGHEVDCEDEGREKEAESIRLIKSSRSSDEVQGQQVSLSRSAMPLAPFNALSIALSLPRLDFPHQCSASSLHGVTHLDRRRMPAL